MKHCDEHIYDRPQHAEAYAFIHLLERYRRMWRVLSELTATMNLPLAIRGVRTLDVGTGPAPTLFAVNDFYRALGEFAETRGVPSLQLPAPELASVEGSRAMERFVHHFCEASGRVSGPFGADWQDFNAFDPAARRECRMRTRVATIMEEDDTSEAAARAWLNENEGWLQSAHTYRLCVFSHFLTKPTSIGAQSQQLRLAFDAVTPGGVVLVMGGVGAQYPESYVNVESLAVDAGLRRLDVEKRFGPPAACDACDPIGKLIKGVYARVWDRLGELGHGQTEGLDELRDVWDPETPYSTTPFALRAFRRDGRDG